MTAHQVRVAAALAQAVDGALDHGRAHAHRGQRPGHGHAAVVVAVDAHVAGVALADLGDGVSDVLGQGSAVGVAEHEELRAGGAGGLERLQGVAGVGRVAVKEVLRVEEHGLARAHEELHGVKDHVEVVLQRGAQDVRDVKVPGLSKDRRALASDARKHVEPGVLVGAHADRWVDPKATRRACLGLQVRSRS